MFISDFCLVTLATPITLCLSNDLDLKIVEWEKVCYLILHLSVFKLIKVLFLIKLRYTVVM